MTKNSFTIGFYHFPPLIVGKTRDILINSQNLKYLSEQILCEDLNKYYNIQVFGDGLFKISTPKFDAETLEKTITSFLICLYSETNFWFPRMNFSLHDMMAFNKNGSVNHFGVNHMNQILYEARKSSKSIPILKWYNKTRSELQTCHITNAIQKFAKLDNSPIQKYIFSLLLQSHVAYQNYRFNECLGFCWLIIETILGYRWEQYIETHPNRLNSNRRKNLKKNLTISEKIEILDLTNILPKSFPTSYYNKLSTIRKLRNDFFHELKPVSGDAASDSIELAQELIYFYFGVKVSCRIGRILVNHPSSKN